MKRILMFAFLVSFTGAALFAQKIEFEEYTLSNGLHVILHQDKTAPLVRVEVMYDVGSKDDPKNKTGFAHFFEHLLFEGTKNIERGEWFKMVSSNGGRNNANTSYDRTTYFEIFPSNQLELGLWMEAERMLHPVINEIGVTTQNGVIKEERRQTQDNRPYGNLISQVTRNLYKDTGYEHEIIGSMEDLDNATLQDFIDFHKTFYVPNNAVLVVAGDFDTNQAKKWIDQYFASIPRGKDIVRNEFKQFDITEPITASFEDPNIQIPMMVLGYKTPPATSRESKILDMVSSYLSEGNSSVLYRKMVDDKKMALGVGAVNLSLKEGSMYVVYGLPMGTNTMDDLIKEIDVEIAKLQKELISERDYQKLMNIFETNFVSSNSSAEAVGSNLASAYNVYGDANHINKELEIYRSITREEIRDVVKKYLNPNQRLYLRYTPENYEDPKAEVVEETTSTTGKILYINRDPKNGKVDEIPTNLPAGTSYKVIENSEELKLWKEQNKANKLKEKKGSKVKNIK